MSVKRQCVIIDIHGTIFKHVGPDGWHKNPTLLPGVKERFREWESLGCTIILVTAVKESMRELLERQLNAHQLFWDHLIMNVGSGARHLINDVKPGGRKSAFAYNLERDAGLGDDALIPVT